MTDLGLKIRTVRKEKNMTQEELAHKIGVKRAVVSKYETNTVIPSIDMLNKISKALEISVGLLLENEDIFKYDEELQNKTQRAFDLMIKQRPQNKLIEAFNKLNGEGQKVAVDRVEELTEIPEYKK